MTTNLFTPLTVRDVTFRNRIAVSPMCQYSSVDGLATDWHLVHLGSRAVGGAGLVMTEAAAVEARGRISPADAGIWKDEHIDPLARITRFLREQGAVAGIQLAHAGRKASTRRPWEGGGSIPEAAGGWPTVAPSAVPFEPQDPAPAELSHAGIQAIVDAFVTAARRALQAGFQVVEIHAAHGYLIHEFLSPLSNRRTDEYGGSLENRMRFALEVAQAVRGAWPLNLPLFLRISATDWVEGGWTPGESVELARRVRPLGVDLIDCSSGGITEVAPILGKEIKYSYQVPLSEYVRRHADIMTMAVGLITEAKQAEEIVASGKADMVALARGMLYDPRWPWHAAAELGAKIKAPNQYLRAAPRQAPDLFKV